jgi:cell division protein FtsN
MTRDYKPSARHRAKRSSGSGSSMLVGILIGLLLGLAIALAVAIYLNKMPSPFLSNGKGHEEEAPPQPEAFKPVPLPGGSSEDKARTEDKPRFDFYSILPGNEEPAPSRPEKQERAQPAPPVKETFYLQAGAFHSPAEADNMKARLALLGIEASVQSNASTERGTLHRVRIGPFSRVEDVNRTRDTLKQNGIETTLIKGRESTN